MKSLDCLEFVDKMLGFEYFKDISVLGKIFGMHEKSVYRLARRVEAMNLSNFEIEIVSGIPYQKAEIIVRRK